MSDLIPLRFQHSSLQFSDSSRQQRRDVRDLFSQGKDWPIKTGTEAGPDARPNDNRRWVKHYAQKHNHRLVFFRGNWIAVDRAIIVPGTVVAGSVFVADSRIVAGPGHDSGFATIAFDHRDRRIGSLAIAACHYPTKGRRPGDPNHRINRRYAEALGRWAKREGRGAALAFVAGDFNMPWGTRQDVFFNQPITSAPDELGKAQNTGHGPIDGHASYDRDGRVSAKRVNVLTDKEFHQHSDHYVVRTVFNVRARAA